MVQVLGAASAMVNTGMHPAQLKGNAESPGGTTITIAGIHELEKGGYRATLMNAVVAISKQSIAKSTWKKLTLSPDNLECCMQ
ncbi:Pyrroline-5-carboxylate reductase [Ancistrocladus abbreviatus]